MKITKSNQGHVSQLPNNGGGTCEEGGIYSPDGDFNVRVHIEAGDRFPLHEGRQVEWILVESYT